MVYLHNLQNTSEDMLYDLLGRYEASHPLTLEPSLSLSSFSWSEEVEEKVAAELNTTGFQSKLVKLSSAINSRPVVSHFTNLLQDVLGKHANKCPIRTNKKFPQNSWFDHECIIRNKNEKNSRPYLIQQVSVAIQRGNAASVLGTLCVNSCM